MHRSVYVCITQETSDASEYAGQMAMYVARAWVPILRRIVPLLSNNITLVECRLLGCYAV
jgi:hypothetical protein